MIRDLSGLFCNLILFRIFFNWLLSRIQHDGTEQQFDTDGLVAAGKVLTDERQIILYDLI